MHIFFKNIILIVFLFLKGHASSAQSIKMEGTHPPDSSVLKLLDEYGNIFEKYKIITERDAKRKTIVSPAYFYHGMDGAPISLEGLTRRQTNNRFTLLADSVYDKILYQYEHTAVYIFKEWQHLIDKGIEKKGVNSVLIVLG